MKTIVLVALAAITAAFASCKNQETKVSDSLKTKNADTSETVNEKMPVPLIYDMNKLNSKFPEVMVLPLNTDSVFESKSYIANSEEGGAILHSLEVEFLSQNIVENDIYREAYWDFDAFFKIDSIKSTGTYEAWVEKGDIGMTLYSSAFPIAKLKTDENQTSMFLWAMTASTMDACPYADGTSIFLTSVKDGAVMFCTPVAISRSGGDAPYFSETILKTTISKDKVFKINYKSVEGGDTDEDGNEMIDSTMTIHVGRIIDGKFALETKK